MNFSFYNKYSSFSLLLHFYFVLIILSQITLGKTGNSNNLPIKRMIITLIPGGHSNKEVIENLLSYTLTQEDEFRYEYHIITHIIDSDFWVQKIKANKNNISYKLYIYGDQSTYEESWNSATEEMKNNPTFGFFGFNKAMILNVRHFMESDILQQLKKLQNEHKSKFKEDYFHMIATDVPSFIHKLIYLELNIKSNIYIQPSLFIPLYYPNFELNSAYTPMIGTLYSDEMSFSERLKNSFIFTFTKILFKMFRMYQTQIINSYGYDLDGNIHIYDSFHLIQYPLGLCFPISLPPNFVFLGSVTSQPAQTIKDKNIDKFLSKYSKNAFIANKSIFDYISRFDIFNELEKDNIGFIVSVDNQVEYEDIKNFPKNVYVTRVIEPNNILGDKRINLIVTDGGFNSVQESVYHEKPLFVLGNSLEQFNVATLVKKKKLGEVIQDKYLINKENIISAIKKVLNSEEYFNNVKKVGEILRNMKNPREEFKYWIDYGFKFGYQHLEIPAYKYKYSWILINGYDIAIIWVIIFLVILYIIKRIYNCIHDCLCGKCENKHKGRNRKNHYKFD